MLVIFEDIEDADNEKIRVWFSCGELAGFAGGVGAISCGAISYRYGKTGIYALLGGVLGACAASMVTDDVSNADSLTISILIQDRTSLTY